MAKIKFRIDSKKAGAIIIAFIMLFSALGIVGDYFTQKKDTTKGTHLGLLGGKDVYMVTENDYFILDNERGIELHFRSNPLEAQNVQIAQPAIWMIDYLKSGPSQYLAVFYNTTKVAVLVDPEEDSRVITAATEITQSLGAVGWPAAELGVAFTKPSGRKDIPVMTEKDAHASNDTMYFYLFTKPGENTTMIKHMGKIIYVQAGDYDSLDLAADRVKLRLLGYT